MPTPMIAAPPTRKISVNLSDEATRVVRELAEARGGTASDVIREALALYKFLYSQLQDGAELELVKEGDRRERVHLIFAP